MFTTCWSFFLYLMSGQFQIRGQKVLSKFGSSGLNLFWSGGKKLVQEEDREQWAGGSWLNFQIRPKLVDFYVHPTRDIGQWNALLERVNFWSTYNKMFYQKSLKPYCRWFLREDFTLLVFEVKWETVCWIVFFTSFLSSSSVLLYFVYHSFHIKYMQLYSV